MYHYGLERLLLMQTLKVTDKKVLCQTHRHTGGVFRMVISPKSHFLCLNSRPNLFSSVDLLPHFEICPVCLMQSRVLFHSFLLKIFTIVNKEKKFKVFTIHH